ncbi:hypothetical protein [Clostridioides sp. ZZV15-6597]|uniref:hypothetical protein n=1 Tax=Clostridioides sp. ZZV15-6597 TaxID=2811500 RepID=UPI001D118F69|nr:hypothetical protein [Clostridioides sp. ZZV15-6597]HBF1820560.1 hypothetical protein [Clostridioides difficile]
MITFSANPNPYGAILNLNLSSLPKTKYGEEWFHDLWIKCCKHPSMFKEGVNPDNWGYKCDSNTKISLSKKEVPIIKSDENSDSNNNRCVGVIDTILGEIDNNLDKVLEESSFQSEISKFLEIRDRLMITDDIDLFYIVKKALAFNSVALDKLKYISNKYSLENTLKEILVPKCFELLCKSIENTSCFA